MTAPEEQYVDTRADETGHAASRASDSKQVSDDALKSRSAEYGGRRNGLDPVRYGDWEKNGRCIDF